MEVPAKFVVFVFAVELTKVLRDGGLSDITANEKDHAEMRVGNVLKRRRQLQKSAKSPLLTLMFVDIQKGDFQGVEKQDDFCRTFLQELADFCGIGSVCPQSSTDQFLPVTLPVLAPPKTPLSESLLVKSFSNGCDLLEKEEPPPCID